MAATIGKILSQRSHIVPGRIKVTEYFFEVPLHWTKPASYTKQTISLFARAAERVDKPADPSFDDSAAPSEGKPKPGKTLPWLLYLQGGPGFGCSSPENAAWSQTMLERGYKILCLDQRGTGLSTPMSAFTLKLQGNEADQVEYMRSFRADSIVQDCEAVRKALTQDLPADKQKWSIMGQSFGGFCALTYLSFAPQGLREAFLYGGLAPIHAKQPEEVYRALYQRVESRNEAYYRKYPEDVERVRRICRVLQDELQVQSSPMSRDDALTARRFLQMGLSFGTHGGIDAVNDCVLRATNDLDLFKHITKPTACRIKGMLSFNEAIIYAILHESIYCSGEASNWSASRMQDSASTRFELPGSKPPASPDDDNTPIYFTGEMIYPWMFSEYSELREISKQAELVAQISDWPDLYDLKALARNEVPVYAAVYYDDMYVDFDHSMKTARAVGNCKVHITNAMYHDAIRSKMDDITKALFALRDDVID